MSQSDVKPKVDITLESSEYAIIKVVALKNLIKTLVAERLKNNVIGFNNKKCFSLSQNVSLLDQVSQLEFSLTIDIIIIYYYGNLQKQLTERNKPT